MVLSQDTYLQNGKYRIIRVLGQGGFGITYLAENTYFDKKVAIKEFFPKDFCGRDNTSHLTLGTQNNAETVEKLKARFLKEAKNIAKLDHPGIVKIHDIFEENNTAYYVMDYIEGENLNEKVKRYGPLSETMAVEYIKKVGETLEYIHSRNMTHFDVKPANIVIRRKDDSPVLIDFGLSKQYDAFGDATSTLMQAVSHGYSPIELYNSSSITSFSPQTDVYSLGATFYFLLTGTVPPPASEVLENGMEIPSHVSKENREAICKAMSVSRKSRPENIKGFLSLLTDRIEKRETCQNQSETIVEETKFLGIEDNQPSTRTSVESTSEFKKRIIEAGYIQSDSSVLQNGFTSNTNYCNNETSNKKSSGFVITCILLVVLAIITIAYCMQDDHKPTTNVSEEISSVVGMHWYSPLGESLYSGDVNADRVPDGTGYFTVLSGQYDGCIYNGEIVNGQLEGKASYTQSNGDTFKGTFKDNKYSEGVYTTNSTGDYFKGTFDNNGQPFSGRWYDRNSRILSQIAYGEEVVVAVVE